MTARAHLLQPGDMLGDFRVKRFLANGGMGEIYEAEQIRLDKRRVALKVIRRGSTQPEMRARFLREQGVLAKLHQTNIVPVFAAGEKGEVQYFAMQYIDGATFGNVVNFLRTRSRRPGVTGQTPSLAKLVESAVGSRNDPMASTVSLQTSTTEKRADAAAPELTKEYLRSVATSLADVAEALNAAHAAGFLHRDIKPSNLMAESSGKCWVIDFGLAGLVSGPVGQVSNLSSLSSDPALTATGSIMGTYAYMAPEQFAGLADPRTDVWALGVTLYELLALDRPFHGPNYREQILESEPADIRSVSSIVPVDLAAICNKAMRKLPNDRYQTAEGFAADLRCWLNGEPIIANPPWVGRRIKMWAKRKPGWAAMVGVACAAVIGVSGLMFELQRRDTRAAKAETTTEKLRAEAADLNANFIEERATQAELQHTRERQVGELENEFLSPHSIGWSERLWRKGMELKESRIEPALRDRMAAMLGGLDAKLVQDFDEGPANYLAYDQSGKQLLIGGVRDRNHPDQPSRVRDLTSGRVKPSTRQGDGPVGWRGKVPVQLAPPESRNVIRLGFGCLPCRRRIRLSGRAAAPVRRRSRPVARCRSTIPGADRSSRPDPRRLPNVRRYDSCSRTDQGRGRPADDPRLACWQSGPDCRDRSNDQRQSTF